ncbi:MAG: hypothetical protein Q9M19_04220 [Mariprofundaceae bacterium]|nr:hypothetical protein [Mariprofundaceae bacterium]
MSYFYKESFFRPAAIAESDSRTAALLFNTYRLLLMKSEGNCVFVPIREMQYQAVLTADEVIFVASEGGYAIDVKGEGGRIVQLSWRWQHSHDRDSLNQPVPLHVTFYHRGLEETQRLLLSLLPAALQAKLDILERGKDTATDCIIIPFHAP